MVENTRYGNKVIWAVIIVCILSALANFLPIDSVEANNQFTIQMDGKRLEIPENLGIIKDGRVFVPIRFIAEELHAQVHWDSAQQKVTIDQNQNKITLWIGSHLYRLNEVKRTVDVTPFIHQNRALVPLRFVSEALGLQVHWDPARKVVSLNSSGVAQQSLASRSADSISNDVYFLAKIIHAEARGESLLGQVAVGAVVLNRVKSRDFPNTIYEVIVEKTGPYYQFEAVQNGSFFRLEPDTNAITAAKRALGGEDPTKGALFFHNPTISKSPFMASKPVAVRIGKHDFLY